MPSTTPWGPFPTYLNTARFQKYVLKHGYPRANMLLSPEENERIMWRHWANVWREYVDDLIKHCDSLAKRLEDAAAKLRGIYESIMAGNITDYSQLTRISNEAKKEALKARFTIGMMYKHGCLPPPPGPRPFSKAAITPPSLMELEEGRVLKAHLAADALERIVLKWKLRYKSELEDFRNRIV